MLAGKAGSRLGDGGVAREVVVAPRQERGAGGRAQRRGVPLVPMRPRSASFCSSVGISMRPPNGDHAASPVSSYSTKSTLGYLAGAFFGVDGSQSGTESQTSSLIMPLNFLSSCNCLRSISVRYSGLSIQCSVARPMISSA